MDLSFANARPEKEYFFKVDQELIKALHAQDEALREAKIRELHYMKCPKCGHDLMPAEVTAMTVERCTGCDGVFLDKEEWTQLFGPQESSESFISTLHTLLVGDDKPY